MAVVGIRREDKSVFERRVPLVPADVALLVEQGIDFEVERSRQRCISDSEFEEAGATLVDDLDRAAVVLGVKEIPAEKIRDGLSYLFFSHTIKGQPYNMPLLRTILDRGCTLLDYELIRDENGVRTVAFGRHAGLAGAIDTLHALGQRLLLDGHDTPMARVKSAREYGEVAVAEHDLKRVAEELKAKPLPEAISPLVLGVTGEGGKVWGGACEILRAAGAQEIEAHDVADFVEKFRGAAPCLHFASYDPGDLVEPIDDRAYEFQDYLDHPEAYRARFSAALEHLSAVVYGILWSPGYPRFILRSDVARLFESAAAPRLRVVCDITCDPGGSDELLDHTTDPGQPCYVVNPADGSYVEGMEGSGVLVWAVDILPAEIPVDASRHFSEVLTPLVAGLARDDLAERPEDLRFPAALRGAFLTQRGQLLPDWEPRLREALYAHGLD